MCLSCSCCQESYVSGSVDNRFCQGDAVHILCRQEKGFCPGFFFVYDGGPGKKGKGVTIVAHAQQYQVETIGQRCGGVSGG